MISKRCGDAGCWHKREGDVHTHPTQFGLFSFVLDIIEVGGIRGINSSQKKQMLPTTTDPGGFVFQPSQLAQTRLALAGSPCARLERCMNRLAMLLVDNSPIKKMEMQ